MISDIVVAHKIIVTALKVKVNKEKRPGESKITEAINAKKPKPKQTKNNEKNAIKYEKTNCM